MSAHELLQKIREGARYGNIQLNDVEEVLSNELFSSNQGLLATTEGSQSTLLHLAAQTQGDTVLPLVCQAYKRSKLFSEAMSMVNSAGLSPLHVAIQSSRFENSVLLFKESQEHCPGALDPDQDGWTLLHSAALSAENVSIVKYLLSQDVCRHMILRKGKSRRRTFPCLPQDIAKDLVTQSEFHVKTAEEQLQRFTKQAGLSSFARENHTRTMVEPKKKILEKARELYTHIEQVTLELKAAEAEKLVKDLEKAKAMERQANLNRELQELVDSNKWESMEVKYLLSDSEETRKMTVEFLVVKMQSESISLPVLTLGTYKTLSEFLSQSETDPSVLSTLKLLEGFTKNSDSVRVILTNTESDLLPRLIHFLSSLDTTIQSVTSSVLLNLVCNESDVFPDKSDLVEALQLLKHFSLSATARRLSQEVLIRLDVDQTPPDPGSWSVRQVSLWLDSITEFEQRSEYIAGFKRADINGLHLLELSVGEMGGLGVKFVSHQRKLLDKVDELRRMNMRSMVGRKDVFLSYAHTNINFARRVKRVLNNAQYSVWIDEAGIRAGQRWRNEIADGIQGCGVLLFLLSKRAANSQYCQNEVSLAEMYSKPIVTVKVEPLEEVDPGLQFVIGRRQWLDFSQEDMFQAQSKALVDTIASYIGTGKWVESEKRPLSPPPEHLPDQAAKQPGSVELGSGPLVEGLDKLRIAMETQLSGLTERLEQFERSLDEKLEEHHLDAS